MKEIVFLGLPAAQRESVQLTVERFVNVRKLEAKSTYIDKMAAVGYTLEGRKTAVFFVCMPLDKLMLNSLMVFLDTRVNSFEHIVLPVKSWEALTPAQKRKNMYCMELPTTGEFVFDCLNSLIFKSEIVLDMRLLQGIILSVVEVVSQTFNLSLKPLPIAPLDLATPGESDFSSINALFGDGINGAIVVKADNRFVQNLIKSSIGEAALKNAKANFLIGVVDELSNQIVGSFRNTLLQNGYQIEASWRLTTYGENHSLANRSLGRYFKFPFALDDMQLQIEFCYQSYIRNMREDYVGSRNSYDTKRVDVRIINELIETVVQQMNTFTKQIVAWRGAELMKNDDVDHHGIVHVASCVGSQGEILFYLSIPETAKTMILAACSFQANLWPDLLSELNNQIRGALKTKLKGHGYYLDNQFEVLLKGTEKMACKYRSSGQKMKLLFALQASEFEVVVDISSSYCANIFDLADYLNDLSQNTQTHRPELR